MDLAFWQRQLEAFYSAPIACLFFLAIGATAAWWFRGTTTTGELNARAERIAVLEERLHLAAEKIEERDEARERLEQDLKKLKAQVDSGASRKEIETTTNSATVNLAELNERSSLLRNYLIPPADPWMTQVSDAWTDAGNGPASPPKE